MNALNELAIAVSIHLDIHPDSITRIEIWEKVIFVVIKGKGARFVTKRVFQIAVAQERSTLGQVCNLESIVRIAPNLYKITVREKVEPSNILADICFSSYFVTRDEAPSIWGRWIIEDLRKVTMGAKA